MCLAGSCPVPSLTPRLLSSAEKFGKMGSVRARCRQRGRGFS